jgi:hypothetical protein
LYDFHFGFTGQVDVMKIDQLGNPPEIPNHGVFFGFLSETRATNRSKEFQEENKECLVWQNLLPLSIQIRKKLWQIFAVRHFGKCISIPIFKNVKRGSAIPYD